MSAYLLDTNALVYYYHGDPLGREVERMLRQPSDRFYVTNLTVLELRSALASKVRASVSTVGSYRLVTRRFAYDISSMGRFRVQPIRNAFVNPCERMIDEYGFRQGLALETLDCLHLLAALDLKQREPDLRLVTADRAFASVATVAEVSVFRLSATE